MRTIFRYLILVTSIFTLTCGFPYRTYASEVIEPDKVEALQIDPRSEVPEYKLNPVPTPAITQEIFTVKDNRAWVTSPYREDIEKAATTYDLDPQLLYATIMTESEGNEFAFRYEPHIKDASFCVGQILLSTARSLGFSRNPKDLYQPEICIDLIGKYYRVMLDTHGELSIVQLARAYNAGSPYKRAVRGHVNRFTFWYNEKAS